MVLQISASRELNTAISFSALSFHKSTDEKPFLMDQADAIICYVYDETQG